MNTILDLGDFGEVEADVFYNVYRPATDEEEITINKLSFTFAGKDVQVDAEYLTGNSYEVLQDKISEYERWHQ